MRQPRIYIDNFCMIHDLPQEVLEDTLIHCDPCDVAAVSQTCRRLRDLIYFSDDNHLWRALYLSQPLDDPRICVDQAGRPVGRTGNFDWKIELHAVTRARSVLNDPKLLREGELVTILRTLLKLATNTRPISPSFSNYDDISQNLLWVAAHLRKHDDYFLDYALRPDLDASSEEIQLRSRLHAYFGVTHGDVRRSARSASRAYVYSLRNYSDANQYGPYMMDYSRKVNWVHIQAIHHIFALHTVNIQENDVFEYAIIPMSMPHIQPIVGDVSDLDGETDWAQVEGDWNCSFCFCDHRDLLGNQPVLLLHYDADAFILRRIQPGKYSGKRILAILPMLQGNADDIEDRGDKSIGPLVLRKPDVSRSIQIHDREAESHKDRSIRRRMATYYPLYRRHGCSSHWVDDRLCGNDV